MAANPADIFRACWPDYPLNEAELRRWYDYCEEPATEEKNMKHCMIDCETLGLVPGCAILSIGAVVFEPETGVLHDDAPHLHLRIDLVSSVLAGFTIDPATVKWWQEQSPEARKALVDGDKVSVLWALNKLHDFYSDNQCECVWANGPMADIAWLEAAYRLAGGPGMSHPWSYRHVRDFRTVWELGGLTDRTTPILAHSARSDAEAQAQDVCRAYSALELRRTSGGAGVAPSHTTDRTLPDIPPRPEGEGWEFWAPPRYQYDIGYPRPTGATIVDFVRRDGQMIRNAAGDCNWRCGPDGPGRDYEIVWWRLSK